MRIIDLTQEIYAGMPVYPGDPEVEIDEVFNIKEHEWNVSRIHMNTHDGTHVNIPFHAGEAGKTLTDYNLDSFIAETRIYKTDKDIQKGKGIIFRDQNINEDIEKILLDRKPALIGLSEKFDFDLDIEKKTLQHGLISFENLTNVDNLPDAFIFYGIPLPIKNGDGSPVRAFAVIDN